MFPPPTPKETVLALPSVSIDHQTHSHLKRVTWRHQCSAVLSAEQSSVNSQWKRQQPPWGMERQKVILPGWLAAFPLGAMSVVVGPQEAHAAVVSARANVWKRKQTHNKAGWKCNCHYVKLITLHSCCGLGGNQIKGFEEVLLLAFSLSNTNLLLKGGPHFLSVTREKMGLWMYVQAGI